MALYVPIEPLEQQNENDCTLTCLRMALRYYNINSTPEEIVTTFIKPPDDDGYTILTEIARYAKSQGLNVALHAFNFIYTNPYHPYTTIDELITALKTEAQTVSNKWDTYNLQSLVACLNAGVTYAMNPPNIHIALSYVSNRIPIILNVNSCVFYKRKGDAYQTHTIVLCGFHYNEVYYADPSDGQFHTITFDDLLAAHWATKIIIAPATMVAISGNAAK